MSRTLLARGHLRLAGMLFRLAGFLQRAAAWSNSRHSRLEMRAILSRSQRSGVRDQEERRADDI
jgi:hypothetical protein